MVSIPSIIAYILVMTATYSCLGIIMESRTMKAILSLMWPFSFGALMAIMIIAGITTLMLAPLASIRFLLNHTRNNVARQFNEERRRG